MKRRKPMHRKELQKGINILKENIELSNISTSINLIDHRIISLRTRLEIGNFIAEKEKNGDQISEEKSFSLTQSNKSSSIDLKNEVLSVKPSPELSSIREEISEADKIAKDPNINKKESEEKKGSDEQEITPLENNFIQKEEKGTISIILDGEDININNVSGINSCDNQQEKKENGPKQDDAMNLEENIDDSLNF